MTPVTEDAVYTAGGRLELWRRFCGSRWADPDLEATLDVSRVRLGEAADSPSAAALARALTAMAALERGARANGDEGRMVGHYWLRAPGLAPSADIGAAIRQAQADVQELADAVRKGRLSGHDGPFRTVIHVGIGGSSLGPQLLADALGEEDKRIRAVFLDNADPDGLARVIRRLP